MATPRSSLDRPLTNHLEHIPPTAHDLTEGTTSLVESLEPTRDELLNSWRTEIAEWSHTRDSNGLQELCLHGVRSEALLQDVWEICLELKIKPRFDWKVTSRTLTLRMINEIQEIPWGQMTYFNMLLDAHMMQVGVAPCGLPSVTSTGAATIQLKNGDEGQPDGAFRVSVSRDMRRHYMATPSVILVTACSQSLLSAKQKACNYLFHSSNGIRAVVICDMSNPIPDTPTFRAEMSVWVREPLGNAVNTCQFVTEEAAAHHFQPVVMADNWNDGRLGPTGPLFRHDGMTIYRRNAQPIVVFDEALGDAQPASPMLRLHVYDFILPCDRYPNGRVPEELQWIDLSLEWIQVKLGDQIAGYRTLNRDFV